MESASPPPRLRTLAWKGVLLVALAYASYLFLAPTSPGGIADAPYADKLGHLLIFAALAALARLAYPERPAWGAFVALVVYGAAIELAQARIGRDADWLDLGVDALGALVAFAPWPRPPP